MVVERKDGWASGEDYEPYVGRWSRLVAREFVGWLDVLPNRQWLDVGCGTGALSDVVLERLARPSNRYRSGWRLCFLCTPKSYRSARDLSGHAPAIAGVFTPRRSTRRRSNASSRKVRVRAACSRICAIQRQTAAMPRSDSSQPLPRGTIRELAPRDSNDEVCHGPVL
jgi:SAM-dependent methyltransferase